jgi:hypothetical protein
MKHESDPRLVKRLGTFAGASSLFSMATNRGRLAGWAFHFEIPKSWSANRYQSLLWVPAKPAQPWSF